MLMFTLALSCLTTSNLPWFMDLTFKVLMQYCSLQHQTLLPSPLTSTTGCCFCFGSVSSFFLELFLHWSPVAYWASTNLGSSSFSVISCCLFILFMRFSRHEYWSGLPSHSPVDHVLLELSTTTHSSWVALPGMAHSFIELDKAVVHEISLVSFLWLWFSVCLPSDGWGWEAYGSVLMGETDWGESWVLFWWAGPCSVNLIQFSIDEWSCVPSLLFTWGQIMVKVMKIMVTSFQRSYACTATLSVPNSAAGHHWPTPPLETSGHS